MVGDAPGADGVPSPLLVATEVLGRIRKAKSDAKVSMRAEVETVTVTDTPDRIAALSLAAGDVRSAGSVLDLQLAGLADGAEIRRGRPRPGRRRRRPPHRREAGPQRSQAGRLAPPARREPPALDRPDRDEILARHERALASGMSTYVDPATGYTVLTADYLAERGYCCSSGCRHCPWEPTAPDADFVGRSDAPKLTPTKSEEVHRPS